jgi:hypothetical protein
MLKEEAQYTMSYPQLQKIAGKALGKNFSADKLREVVRSVGVNPGERMSELKAKQIFQNLVGYESAAALMKDFHTWKKKWILSNRESFYSDLDKKRAAQASSKGKDLFSMKSQLK